MTEPVKKKVTAKKKTMYRCEVNRKMQGAAGLIMPGEFTELDGETAMRLSESGAVKVHLP